MRKVDSLFPDWYLYTDTNGVAAQQNEWTTLVSPFTQSINNTAEAVSVINNTADWVKVENAVHSMLDALYRNQV